MHAMSQSSHTILPRSRPSTSASRLSIGSMDSRMEDFPDGTNAQILALAFGVGPCADLLFVGLDDDSVCIIDSGIFYGSFSLLKQE
jgi:hypothetical protein